MYTYRICWDETYTPLETIVSKTLRCTTDTIVQTAKQLLDDPNTSNITIEELVPSPSLVINTVDGILQTLQEASK